MPIVLQEESLCSLFLQGLWVGTSCVAAERNLKMEKKKKNKEQRNRDTDKRMKQYGI